MLRTQLLLGCHLVGEGAPICVSPHPFVCVPASKRDIELLLKLIANLNMLLKDENVNVVKKAILTMTQLYKVALQVRDPLGAGK